MVRPAFLALFAALLVLAAGSSGQDAQPKQDSKKEAKKDDPPVKLKGMLPPNWRKLGLSDSQVQEIYKAQNKYNTEIDKLEAKIAELKSTRDKEMKAVLTEDQKKRLIDIQTGKDK